MRTSKYVLKIRRAEIEDQQQITELLSTFKLPIAGLGNTLEIWGKQGLLRSAAVSKNMHNRGCGTSLINHIIKEAKKGGGRVIFVNHDRSRFLSKNWV